MIRLLNHIYSTLRTEADRVYLENVPYNATAKFPYIVYRIPASVDDFGRQDFIMEVDIWDNDSDNTQIENLTDSVDAKLHRLQYYKKGELQTSIYRIGRLMIPTPDPTIRRRQLRYQAKTYIGA